MARAVRTFDVFDTLIARRSVEPQRVLERLEARAGLPGLAAARLDADRRLWAAGRPFTLADLWRETGRALGLDAATTARLLDLEIQLEHDEVIPVADHLALVQDGDVLVSDTYLPADVVWSLLGRAGLTRQVALVLSNDGKSRGWLWPELLRTLTIRGHLGDNPHSDGQSPAAAGVPAALTTLAQRSPVERLLTERGWPALAHLAREARLACPFPAAEPRRRHLWLLGCQLNFPLLYAASRLLERHAAAHGLSEIFFVSRDGWLWQRLYRALFRHRRATYLYTSRKCLFHPSPGYLAYFRAAWHAGAVIVDLLSTGSSWSRFFARLGTRGRFFFLGRIDNYAYVREGGNPQEWMDMATLFRTSELSRPGHKALEMLNYAPHPVVEDVLPLPGGAALPVLAEALEYDPALPRAVEAAFALCLDRLPHYPELGQGPAEGLPALVKALVELICADPHLGAIYPAHQAIDAAYMQRVLAAAPPGPAAAVDAPDRPPPPPEAP
jgi:hypothetical protein